MLNLSFEYADYSSLEENKRFLTIFALLMEITEKSDLLLQIVKGSYFV